MKVRGLAGVAALVLGAALLGVPAAQAATTPATTPATATGTTAAVDEPVALAATFNDPAGSGAAQDAIRNQLISLVNRTPAGAEINGSIYLFTDGGVSSALIAAKQRGVKVKVIVDGDAVPDFEPGSNPPKATGSEYSALAAPAALGTDLAADSWVLACPSTRGCIGNRVLSASDDGAINHNKFFLFSRVGVTDNVVFQTSANLTTSQRKNLFNNAVTVPDGGSGLYSAYRAYWQDLATNGASGAGLATYYRTQQSGPYKTYFFPRKESAGSTYDNDASTDTVVSLLDNVDCAGGATRIRIGMYAFTRVQVADKLVALKQAGCGVELLHNGESGNLGSAVQDALTGRLDLAARCQGSAANGDGTARTIGIHSKYLLIEGTYLGSANRKVVFTGSHNYTFPNLRSHDETLLKIDDAGVYDAFRANFEKIKASGHCTAW
ncbi:phospholipase D-like domain-containing protein [Kitasatospora sp. NPDC090091]|uniref:phospholipase D-like domain-containing protein n=1 Tax=Kitasatospora sp. NPDC090091 TaxID=3364081 RepID=UPI0038170454